MTQRPSPVILCILDGWGHRPQSDDNAISAAHLPTWTKLWQESPHTLLNASAHHVGLPADQMGNSEVGHMNIGAGRIIFQDLPRIDHAVASDNFKELPAYQHFMKQLRQNQGTCHLMGLMSSGGVHSHQRHLVAFAKAVAGEGIPVNIHAFLDGRDTPPRSGASFMTSFLQDIQTHPLIKVVSLSGRYYAMDRDGRWERLEKAYRAIVEGESSVFSDPLAYIEQNYQQNITDEFIMPAVCQGYLGINSHTDGVFFANFRADRVRQLASALVMPVFSFFTRGDDLPVMLALGMAEYSDTLTPYCPPLFPAQSIEHSLGELVSNQGLKQLRAAETEKYAHVTFFFNGGQEKNFPGEDRLLVASPKVATYDLKPEMSAAELTQKLIQTQRDQSYDLIVINYANADMVGHSGNLRASIKAVETLDHCLSQLCALVDETQGVLLITADHGNVEQTFDATIQQPHTAHTLNPVPFVMYGSTHALTSDLGQLCDVAPTILELMNISQPVEMTGKSLLSKI